jgi:redox-sensitive bicupin YhaK (pirin superfamily)
MARHVRFASSGEIDYGHVGFRELRAQGYDDIETKGLAPATRNAEHSHEFDVLALVLDGSITLAVAGAARAYGAGEVFTMDAGCRHEEQVGEAGVRYLVGRRRRDPARAG